METRQLTLQALFDLFLEKMLEDQHFVRETLVASVKQLIAAFRDKASVAEANKASLIEIESLNLDKQLRQFDASHKTGKMYKWASMYMQHVMTLTVADGYMEGN